MAREMEVIYPLPYILENLESFWDLMKHFTINNSNACAYFGDRECTPKVGIQ